MSNADPIVDTLEAKAMLQDLFRPHDGCDPGHSMLPV
jgi:hypothetical protein